MNTLLESLATRFIEKKKLRVENFQLHFESWTKNWRRDKNDLA